jgi:hypothetical protein
MDEDDDKMDDDDDKMDDDSTDGEKGDSEGGDKKRYEARRWSKTEDDVLAKAVNENQGKNWKKVAEYFEDRSDVQCLHRWQKVLNPELVKGPWTKEVTFCVVLCCGVGVTS